MDNNNIEEIEETQEIEGEENIEEVETNWWPPQTSPKCVAQVSPTPQTVTVRPSNNCCDNIMIRVSQNINLETREVKVSIIKGKVICNGNSSSPVHGAIVVATTGSGMSTKHYVGITNNLGEYSICVPTPIGILNPSATYSVEAYLVSDCLGQGICTTGPCDSKCK